MSKVRKTRGCWYWTASTNKGYGQFSLNNRPEPAHRLAYEHFVGAIPKELCVLHTCDHPACVKPAHLRAGTHADNTSDKMTRGRHRCNPRKLTTDQVRIVHTSPLSGRALARAFGVSHEVIRRIRLDLSYRE